MDVVPIEKRCTNMREKTDLHATRAYAARIPPQRRQRESRPQSRPVRRSTSWNLWKFHKCTTMRETRTRQPDEFTDSSEQASQNGACPAPGRVNASVSGARSTANCRQQQFFLACFTDSVPTCRHVRRAGYGVFFFARTRNYLTHMSVSRVLGWFMTNVVCGLWCSLLLWFLTTSPW